MDIGNILIIIGTIVGAIVLGIIVLWAIAVFIWARIMKKILKTAGVELGKKKIL